MTEMLRSLGGWWFWVPALTGLTCWALFAAAWWRYGALVALAVTFGGLGLVIAGACAGLVLLFLCDGHEPFCAYAGCRKRAPMQLRGKPYRQPFCPTHAVEAIPPPRPIEALSVDEFPGVIDASGTRSRPR